MKALFRSLLILLFLVAVGNRLSAFQFADAAAPRQIPAHKYIFYWGQQQCDLTAENQYKGRFMLKSADFRQMLLSKPKLWNGTGLITDFSFLLQGFRVHSTDYLAQIAAIDKQFGQNLEPGQALIIHDLNLGGGIMAAIEIGIVASTTEKKPVFGAQGYAPFLNAQMMETVTWGQEEKLEISQRDFFTVAEFREIFGQEPYLEWRSWGAAVPVLAELQILDAEDVTQSLRFRLEEQPYSEFVRQAEVYRHLFKPGVRATLILQTGDQYERLYQKSLQLVAEGDERLRLRRNHDFHTLRIHWGGWGDIVEGLYLKEAIDREGKKLSADQPVNRWGKLPDFPNELNIWTQTGPEFMVDNEMVANASYTIWANDSMSYKVENGKFDSVEFQRIFLQDTTHQKVWKLTDVSLPGYSMPYLQYTFRNNMMSMQQLLSKNSLSTLAAFSRTIPGYTVKPPVKEGNEWKFELESPQRTDLIISIFDSKNRNVFWEDFITGVGKNTHSIPATALTEKGRYTAFLISFLGVTKVEFEVL